MSLFLVAEMSANHLGNKYRAMELVEAAAKAGADAFKVQVWMPDTMCVSQDYVIDAGPWKGQRLVDLYRQAYTPWEWLPGLFARARQLGMVPFGAAFDAPSVDFLDTLNVDRHKVASFELVDLPLVRHMARKGKPVILSTGMASEGDFADAKLAALHAGAKDVLPLACTSAYPAPPAHAGLGNWATMPRWGISDHTLGIGVAVAAVALGASYVEKHLTLDNGDGGLDADFSMDPRGFAQLVQECRRAAAARGRIEPGPREGEHTSLRRSLWVTRDTARGEPLVLGVNVRTARPALGLACDTPLQADGRHAARNLRAGEPLTRECVS